MVCGRYITTRDCTLHSDIPVCIHCCLTCVERDKCPNPVWKITIPQLKPMVGDERRKAAVEKIKADLLSKLGGS